MKGWRCRLAGCCIISWKKYWKTGFVCWRKGKICGSNLCGSFLYGYWTNLNIFYFQWEYFFANISSLRMSPVILETPLFATPFLCTKKSYSFYIVCIAYSFPSRIFKTVHIIDNRHVLDSFDAYILSDVFKYSVQN